MRAQFWFKVLLPIEHRNTNPDADPPCCEIWKMSGLQCIIELVHQSGSRFVVVDPHIRLISSVNDQQGIGRQTLMLATNFSSRKISA